MKVIKMKSAISHEGWIISPHKINSDPSGPFMVYSYNVFDENGKMIDRVNAMYDSDGDISIYSQK